MFIYKLTNTINNKIYIGLTTEKSVAERCRKRNAEAKYRGDKKSYILNAIRKHGENSFISEVIDTATSLEELKEKEIYYISLYNARDKSIGYNLTDGGEGNLGLKMSQETKDKIRDKHLGRKDSDETKLKKSLAKLNSGSDFKKGKENCRIYNIKTSKIILKYNMLGELIEEYKSISEARVKNGIDRSGITAYLQSNKAELNIPYKGFLYKIKH